MSTFGRGRKINKFVDNHFFNLHNYKSAKSCNKQPKKKMNKFVHEFILVVDCNMLNKKTLA